MERGRGGTERSPSLLRDFGGRPQTRPSGGNGNADGLKLGQRPPPLRAPLRGGLDPSQLHGGGGGAEEPGLGGKLPAGLFGFLRFQRRVLSPAAVRLRSSLRTNGTTPRPRPSVILPAFRLQSGRHLFKASSCPPRTRERGWVTRKNFPTYHPSPTGAGAPAPTQSGGSLPCRAEPSVRLWLRGFPFKWVGGAAFNFQLSLPSSHPTPSKRATCPGQSEGGPGVGGQRGQRVVPGHVPAQAPRPCWCLERGRVLCPPPRTTPMYQRAAETW